MGRLAQVMIEAKFKLDVAQFWIIFQVKFGLEYTQELETEVDSNSSWNLDVLNWLRLAAGFNSFQDNQWRDYKEKGL